MSISLQINSPTANVIVGRTVSVTVQVDVVNSTVPHDTTDALTSVTVAVAGQSPVVATWQGGDIWAAQVALAASVPTGVPIPVTATANYDETSWFVPFPEQFPDVWAANIDHLSLTQTVNVRTAATPAFTWTAPANGSTVNLQEGGGDLTVQLTITSADRLPLTVSVSADGKTTAGQYTGGGTYQTPVHLNPMPLGGRSVTVTCADPDGISSSQTRTFTGRDIAPPQLSAAPVSVVADANGNGTIHLLGTAPDTQSGMVGGSASVQWALAADGTRSVAVPLSGNDFSNWGANIALSGFGTHTVYLWATDNAGNTIAKNIQATVISSFVPATLDERLNEREYLAALLSFAQDQVNVPGPPVAPLDTAALVAALGQPVDRLSQPLSATADRGNREINQLRVPVELLRARIAATGTPAAPGSAQEAAYRSAAYASLLAAAGTSYQELRLARGADVATRQALAARLGIRLSTSRPDALDQLLLDGAALSESALETLFGLPSTTASDPLRALPVPQLLAWQLSAQSLDWAEHDQHPVRPRAFAVLADPDVVAAADVVAGTAGDPIRSLLGSRTAALDSFVSSLDAHRTDAPATGFAAILGLAVPGIDLTALANADTAGTDISATLAGFGLSRPGFLYLTKASALTTLGPLTDGEWTDVTSILTGAYKQRVLYPAWRTAESGFVLSPDFFVPGGTAPVVNPYRVDGQARVQWQLVLANRIAERQSLTDATAQAVAAAEQATLPMLRDALLTDLASTAGDVGEVMSARYFVDVLAGGTLRTTRTRQAIESVQSLLSAKLSGEMAADHPAAGWMLKNGNDVFSAAWAWLGQQASWQAATMAFLFPERHLDPALLVPSNRAATSAPPTPLDTLFAAISAPGTTFTAATALKVAATYLTSKPFTVNSSSGYVDPQRTSAHQNALSAQSNQLAHTNAAGARDSREIFWAVPMMLAQRLQAAGDYLGALDWYWSVYPYDQAQPVSIYGPMNNETLSNPNLTFPSNWTAALDPFTLVDDASTKRPMPYTRGTLLAIIRCHLDYADAEFTRETDEAVAHARSLYVTARRLLGSPALVPQAPSNIGEPALPIPELVTLRTRVDTQLAKLRQGRNVAGLPRAQGLAAAAVNQPTPYRFKILLERAKQLTAQAAQMEAGYLAALEKYDDRTLRVYDAVKAIDLTAAQANVAASRVSEASDAVSAALAQQAKATTMVTTYANAIAAPPNQYEQNLLDNYGDLRVTRDAISALNTVIGVAQAVQGAASLGNEILSAGTAGAMAGIIAGATVGRGLFEIQQNDIESQIQANQLQAGIEQRREEWRIQQVSAQQDVQVASAQVTVADDQATIARQEQDVANLQHDQAAATLAFLAGQFTNADLYLWMSNTLGGVYRYFLQQATATARLAQSQLAFERAEPARGLIRQDYSQSPTGLTAAAGANRQGLTGAEQLAEDIDRLDQYAFSSARRRLDLSQTFSLARLMPVEFLDFRRTGTLVFSTPMSLFDTDFPGHYLRLIKQVRASLVALVPPDRGIRATLYSNGISRVTTGSDGTFQDVVVRSDPGVVALTAPINASGIFELDAQSDMLLPFEGAGVDTTWEFQLPPAANPLDFTAIADLLITIDYTAAYDDIYRSQVVTRLNNNRGRGADCVFSLARDFPDQWYDLNNPADPANRSVTLTLRDLDFPLGIDGLSTAAVAVRLSSSGTVPNTVLTLRHDTVGGDATVTDGTASTRRGNAAAWNAIIGSTPLGDWQLSIPSQAAALFAPGGLDDILLVVSWSGLAPTWT